ncbi:carbohydrate kinase family protein [Agromyces cerinus]|uniref:Fructokinase n=1 Tax=Agromyces cerinus subsp. cerinus TaxID=232089 RepID=A0A1N6G9C9_9MICO|nr:PfkB family carbohydrate kinase [Agromyces cerinus]SIO04087.1 fructokinase [Agromyces cerinus subsp. cerinus]
MSRHDVDPSARITVIGDALIDELRDQRGAREFVGGAALNVAVGLALLGEDVTLVAMLGDDEPATRIRSYLRDYGVRLVESPSALGTSRAVSDRTDGEPRYEFNEAAQRRSIRFDEATRAAIDEADLVVVSCFPFDDAEQVAELRDAIARPGERLVIDGNPRAGMLHDREAFLENFTVAARDAMLVKVGDEDAELLLGAPLPAFVERLRTPATGGAATDAASPRTPAVLATAGREGAALHADDAAVHAGIVELPGAVVDTMGAGDATLSAVVHHLAVHGLPSDASDWAAALESAMAIAAATVRHEGALLRVPTRPSAGGS